MKPRPRTPRRRASALAVYLLAIPWVGLTQPFQIQEWELTEQGQLLVRYPADASSYYILYAGTDVAAIEAPVNMALAAGEDGELVDTPTPSAAGFYRVRRVSVTAPLDSDGDGIHDVWELTHRHPGAALNSTDRNEDQTGSGQSDWMDFQDSLPLEAWFDRPEESVLSYRGAVTAQLQFTRPVTGVFTYDIGGKAIPGVDYQPLTGQVELIDSKSVLIPVQILPTSTIRGPRSVVLTLKTPANSVASRIPASLVEGNVERSRFASYVITIRDYNAGLYVGSLRFPSQTTYTVQGDTTVATIRPAPAIAPSALRLAVRAGRTASAVFELSGCVLFPDLVTVPVRTVANGVGFHSPQVVAGQTRIPQLENRLINWQFELSEFDFTETGERFEAACRITVDGLTASGIPTVLNGIITANRIDL